jgi:hypothetical protein
MDDEWGYIGEKVFVAHFTALSQYLLGGTE